MAAAKRKFDPGRPHGVVYGHLSGKFEQDGILYNGAGDPVSEDQIADDEERLAADLDAARASRAKELAAK